jgi:hypothetical protein
MFRLLYESDKKFGEWRFVTETEIEIQVCGIAVFDI